MGGINSQNLRIDKMKRNLVRNVPDAIWKSFDKYDPEVTEKIQKWSENWTQAIIRKHGANIADIKSYGSDTPDHKVRIQMVVVLHDPKRSPFS